MTLANFHFFAVIKECSKLFQLTLLILKKISFHLLAIIDWEHFWTCHGNCLDWQILILHFFDKIEEILGISFIFSFHHGCRKFWNLTSWIPLDWQKFTVQLFTIIEEHFWNFVIWNCPYHPKYTFHCFNMVREKKRFSIVNRLDWQKFTIHSFTPAPTFSFAPPPGNKDGHPLISALPLILINKILGEYRDF